jgi:hypothetical protein
MLPASQMEGRRLPRFCSCLSRALVLSHRTLRRCSPASWKRRTSSTPSHRCHSCSSSLSLLRAEEERERMACPDGAESIERMQHFCSAVSDVRLSLGCGALDFFVGDA